ncbi:ribonuclease HII [Achromobacter sp. GG226]|uniref:ribonuclease HII n=1 Tax=Verticiella alkaliphila TaxID=2779529 RepID=UPI001C0C7A2C|nr:ribonuclease HII [Verticiella sp. GG226]MBU4609854.1 ribonuclease HII [Verticiella sp. GG226]
MAVDAFNLSLVIEEAAPAEPVRRRQRVICGVDEAGRGPLAGPVYAAAVVLNPRRSIDGLDDSKALTAARREDLAEQIRTRAKAWCIGVATVAEIDSLNILQASMLAMYRAVSGLGVAPDLARVDGNRAPKLACAVETVIGGDALVPAISAASILAKTARDRALCDLHLQYPEYGFDQHKGYGTPLHLERLLAHGACPEHRRSFAPVRATLQRDLPPAEPMLALW